MQMRDTAAAIAALTFLAVTACDTAADRSAAKPAPSAPTTASVPAKDEAGEPGSGASEAKLKDPDGKAFSVADLPGKAKVVNFWATWCAPCIHEMPLLNALHRKYEPQGVTFLAVSFDENGRADVDKFLKLGKAKIDFRMAYANVEDKPLGVDYPIPDTLVFDESNKLVKHFDKVITEQELEEAIQAALKQ